MKRLFASIVLKWAAAPVAGAYYYRCEARTG